MEGKADGITLNLRDNIGAMDFKFGYAPETTANTSSVFISPGDIFKIANVSNAGGGPSGFVAHAYFITAQSGKSYPVTMEWNEDFSQSPLTVHFSAKGIRHSLFAARLPSDLEQVIITGSHAKTARR